jgi:hypothetical protein
MAPDREWTAAANQDLFLQPDNLKLSRQLRAGKVVALLAQPPPGGIWSAGQLDEIHKRLHSWLKTRDFEELVTLLKQYPTAFAHPIVLRQWLYLRSLQNEWAEEDFQEFDAQGLEYDLDNFAPVLPAGARDAAGKIMRELLTGWVLCQFPLFPGYIIKKRKGHWPPGPVGRKAILNEEQSKALLRAYNHCRRQLQKHGKRFFKPQRGEPQVKFRVRVARALLTLNLGNIFGASSLSQEMATRIVRKSKGTYSIKFDSLVVNLLAHMAKRTAGQVRGHLQRAEKKWPELHIRRSDAERW